LVQGFEIRDLLALRRVDHVPGVADVDEPTVRAVLEPAEATAPLRRARVLVARQRLREADVVQGLRRRAADIEHVDDAVGRVDHPKLRTVGREREPVIRRIRAEARVPREAFEGNRVQQAVGPPREDPKAELSTPRHVLDTCGRIADDDRVRRRRRRFCAELDAPARQVDDCAATVRVAEREPTV
jgi:hypothetical protein